MHEFLDEQKFMSRIEDLVKNKGVGHMDAVLQFCTENRVDIEEIVPLIGRTLKEKIRVDAENNGLMKAKSARLPL